MAIETEQNLKEKSDYLIVSDFHLVDIEDNNDDWKKYKSSKYLIDNDFNLLVDYFINQGKGSKLTLILNGDIFDFDLVTIIPDNPPWKVTRREKKYGLYSTEEKSVWKLEQILKDHAVFLKTLAEFLDKGNKIIYLLGNHDREFHFKKVQKLLSDQIKKLQKNPQTNKNFKFEEWFYYEPGKLYVEHGQQYDYYSTFKYLLCPTVKCKEGEVIAIPMGNLSNRFLMTNMGFFNPHASDFILNVFKYIYHWLKHYAFSRRSLMFNWLWGSILTMFKLSKYKRKMKKYPPNCQEKLNVLSNKFNIPNNLMNKLSEEEKRPITDRTFRIIREFWLDRVFLLIIFITTTITLALVPIPLWIKLVVPLAILPLVYLLYEEAVQGLNIFTIENELPQHAKKIAEILGVKLVVFGHTHKPKLLPVDNGLTFVDTGNWAPIYDIKGNKYSGYNNYLIASFFSGNYNYNLGSWDINNIRLIPALSESDINIFNNYINSTVEDSNNIKLLAMLGNIPIGGVLLHKENESEYKIKNLFLKKENLIKKSRLTELTMQYCSNHEITIIK